MKLEDANKIYFGTNEVKMIRVGENIIYPKGLVFKNYLENVGNSHIDVGFPMKTSYTIEAKLSVTRTHSDEHVSMFLAEYSKSNITTSYVVFAYIYHSNDLKIGGGNAGWWRIYNNYHLDVDIPFIAKASLYPRFIFALNGQELRNEPAYYDYTSNINAFLFRYSYSGKAIDGYGFLGKCYWCKIWDTDGKLLRDYVPCTYNGENGLWDKVSASFFGNKGLGNFVVG